MKKNFILWLCMLTSIVMLFSGCATNIPITKSVINEVGGVDNTKKFQYYVSETITLKLVAESKKTTIEDGQLIRRSKTAREKVVITKKLPGIVRQGYQRTNGDGFQLKVAFENYEGNPTVSFGQYKEGNDKKYQILFTDSKNRIIKYGNDDYVVNYDGNEAPYLLIKMKQSSEESDKARKAKGLKLGQ